MIVASLRYNDSKPALEWLQQVIGLEPGLIVENPDGTIAHAELWSDGSCVMMGQMHDIVPWHPAPGNASFYVMVDDADRHFDVTSARGAEILTTPYDTDYNSREYTLRDPEGNVWSFGTFVPTPPTSNP